MCLSAALPRYTSAGVCHSSHGIVVVGMKCVHQGRTSGHAAHPLNMGICLGRQSLRRWSTSRHKSITGAASQLGGATSVYPGELVSHSSVRVRPVPAEVSCHYRRENQTSVSKPAPPNLQQETGRRPSDNTRSHPGKNRLPRFI
ncbi:uncharacterized protein LOC123499395 isoform X2 [Portunus trituberculatus]|uniref:uncharacterized protein LOC123499395 isoform X2 n=1 Tax=Portunus trituberculatus TaxID=210409 RepID=UPI001E1D1B96|nr:uncharacterized protein LOC123499395 isoform X2 [Portunus trituberculatus]